MQLTIVLPVVTPKSNKYRSGSIEYSCLINGIDFNIFSGNKNIDRAEKEH